MMQINLDLSTLTYEQCEAIAGFILTYPVATQSVTVAVKADVSEAKAQLDKLTSEIAALNPADDPSVGTEPIDPVVQAFGSVPAPLPVGVNVAPPIAAANPLPIVPAVPLVTSTAPTAPLPPVAPAANVVTTVAATASNPAPVDKDGLPWDARIHSSSKEKIANGTWKKRRGVDPALVVTVENELRQLMGVPQTTAPANDWPFPVPSAPAVTTYNVPQTEGHTGAGSLGHAVAPAADPKTEWVNLIRESTAAQAAGKIKAEEISAICLRHGVPALPLLMNRLDLVAPIAAEIRELVASR